MGEGMALIDSPHQRRYHPRMRLSFRRFLRAIWVFLACMGLLLVLARDWPDRSTDEFQYSSIIRNRRFDFVRWEVEALSSKLLYSLAPAHTFLGEDAQRLAVEQFFDQLQQVRSLEAQITAVYSNPEVADPLAATAEYRRRLEVVRDQMAASQPLAEGIIEEQISAVLADAGIATASRASPPVKLQFTPLPAMLVVSPRDHIEPIHFFALEQGIDTPDRVLIEDEIDQRLDVSSLVTDIGGLAAYPAMMLESSSPTWLVEAAAHEWTHHYLTLHPLGILYDTDPQLRTMNETTADIVGKEIGQQVIARYYPQWTPPPAVDEPDVGAEPVFDFRGEMHMTRIRVDELLAQGQIDQAESYMRERRRVFWNNGYQIRKLNQAYFAFHGAYADEPGATGADPVGPHVLALRDCSESLKEFLETIARLRSYEELEEVLG